MFDYLAGEFFDRFEAATQWLSLRIACVPRVTIELAQTLSGDGIAGRVLINLARNDYFVRELSGVDGRVFVFHPLLREFLLRRVARDLPQALRPEALRHAAALLRESGQAGDAVALAVDAKDWALAGRIRALPCGCRLGRRCTGGRAAGAPVHRSGGRFDPRAHSTMTMTTTTTTRPHSAASSV